MKNLRQRIRPIGISCIPWHVWRGEIDYLPISAKTLFKKSGMAIDIWEMNLKSEGYLFPDEILLEVLKDESSLYRGPLQHSFMEEIDNSNFGLMPDDWQEGDYLCYNKSTIQL